MYATFASRRQIIFAGISSVYRFVLRLRTDAENLSGAMKITTVSQKLATKSRTRQQHETSRRPTLNANVDAGCRHGYVNG